MTIEIKKIPFNDIEACGMSLKDKDCTWSLKEHAEDNNADIAINGAMFSFGNPKTDKFYYWNITDMVINGELNRGGNYSDIGIAFGKPFAGVSAYLTKTANCIGKPVDFVGGAPPLIINGVINMDMKGLQSSFATGYTNRTAIGIDEANIYILTTRETHHTLLEVAKALISMGCKNAIDLDGGGSTAYYEKKPNGAIDYYTQNRNITSAFYLRLKKIASPKPTLKKSVFIGIGHGGSDPGAVANGLRESDINLAIGMACNEELLRFNVKTLMSRTKDENDPLVDEIAECNKFNPTIAIDFHENAGGGDGVEIFRSIVGTDSLKLAQLCEKNIIAIGQNSRGIKTKVNTSGKDYFGFLREIWCPSIIVESAFIDNKEDVSVIDTLEEQKKFGVAYAKAILEYLNIAWVEKPIDIKSNVSYIVQTGKFGSKNEADIHASELLAHGFASVVMEEKI